jgi:hypothetical protein
VICADESVHESWGGAGQAGLKIEGGREGGIWQKLFECAQSIKHGEDVGLRGVGTKD